RGRTIIHFFFLVGLTFILIACGEATNGDATDSTNITNEEPESSDNEGSAAPDNNEDKADEGGKSADTSGLPRFITEPRATTRYFDLLEMISIYEYVVDEQHTYRLEWAAEEEVDGMLADKFHYQTD